MMMAAYQNELPDKGGGDQILAWRPPTLCTPKEHQTIPTKTTVSKYSDTSISMDVHENCFFFVFQKFTENYNI